jgi:hypothetical protein
MDLAIRDVVVAFEMLADPFMGLLGFPPLHDLGFTARAGLACHG